jgi:hypothetical protein
MSRPAHPSLAELRTACIWLRPADAATIARELALQAAGGTLPGIPSSHVIRFQENGEILVEGPVASGREIERAARLLESLLPGFDAPPALRVPGALRLVVARALGTLDLPPFESLDTFADALHRFAEDDARAVVRELVSAWRMATDEAPLEGPRPGEETLTISDIRRARRATHLSLSDIAERSHIPVDRLRELEWGYFANWPSGLYGRAQLVRYARAAGLDERIVTQVALPLLAQWDRSPVVAEPEPQPVVIEPLVEPVVEPMSLVPVAPRSLVPRYQRKPSRTRYALAAAAALLLAVGLLPAVWLSDDAMTPPPAPTARDAGDSTMPPATPPEQTREAKPPTSVEAMDVGFSPAFATVGTAVFYHSSSGARSAIYKADTDASGDVLRVTRVVDDRASNFHARPSPDGSRLAFDSDRDGVRGVYVAEADGNDVRRVSGAGFAAVPSWSPDGRLLAFVRAEAERPVVWNIWLLDLETGVDTRITSHRVGQPWGAAWFPDGKRIAYSHERTLVIRTLDGSRESVFPTPVAGRLVRTPAVSPDGRLVVFQVHRDGGWLLDLATGRMRKVLADPTAEEFTWSPDGRRLAYHSRRTGKWAVRILSAPTPAAN